jgi:hypothetical protein
LMSVCCILMPNKEMSQILPCQPSQHNASPTPSGMQQHSKQVQSLAPYAQTASPNTLYTYAGPFSPHLPTPAQRLTCASVMPGRSAMLMDFNISWVSLSTCSKQQQQQQQQEHQR